jgi:alcohol dehydrogenase class IV
VPPLADFKINAHDFPTIVMKAQKSSSMKGNPIKLTDDELREILERAIEPQS